MKWKTDYKTIIVEPGVITRIIHNEPQKRNALTTTFMTEFPDALRQALLNREVRVVVLTGAGTVFCAGHDLYGAGEIIGHHNLPYTVEDWRQYLTFLKHTYYIPVWHFEKPLICGVQGAVAAGGIALVTMCDISVVAEDCIFSNEIIRVGGVDPILAQAWSGSYRKAMELYLTGKRWDALEAKEMGLITKVVPPDKLEEETMWYAKVVAEMPPESVRTNKLQIKSLYMDLVNRALQLGCDGDIMAHSASSGREAEFGRIVESEGLAAAMARVNAPFVKLGQPSTYEEGLLGRKKKKK